MVIASGNGHDIAEEAVVVLQLAVTVDGLTLSVNTKLLTALIIHGALGIGLTTTITN